MLDKEGFDLWADGYDRATGLSDEESSYPFAGYKEILARIYSTVVCRESAVVLDIGFGTGTLATKLYEHGCELYGQDFSERMVELTRARMANAHLYQGDFAQGLAEPLFEKSYDFIIATYSLHHLSDARKISFLRFLRELLKDDGAILIGDVAFETRAELEACRRKAGEEWDDEEVYFVADELRQIFPDMTFGKISHCAGILTLPR